MTQAFRRKGSVRPALPVSIAVSWASRKLPGGHHCRWPASKAAIPIAYQLYLPKDWAADPVRRKTACVPDGIAFATKPEIALAQMRQAIATGVPMDVVLVDAGYGDEAAFRDRITELGMLYAVGIRPGTHGVGSGTGGTAAETLVRSRHPADAAAAAAGAR